ncbi:MAG TPA: hypothetical protein VMV82_00170 [Candidatus Dormibacteraeota bacterium]|nr:hypothetical protein [Candidatus Dormibacteraeota bacterium]
MRMAAAILCALLLFAAIAAHWFSAQGVAEAIGNAAFFAVALLCAVLLLKTPRDAG